MMTLEEAIDHCEEVAKIECGECAEEHLQLAKWLKELKERRSFDTDLISRKQAINALSTITMYKGSIPFDTAVMRIEQLPSAQPKRGKWIKKHRHYGGFRSYTGFDAMGEQHTITVDERAEYDDLYCSECGARSADNFLNFCPNCGAKMEKE